jgi:hypothetical protein
MPCERESHQIAIRSPRKCRADIMASLRDETWEICMPPSLGLRDATRSAGGVFTSTNWPLLTVAGVVLGALTAAYQHGELHLSPVKRPLFYFINGFLMINFDLILGSCPIRIVLLSSYGSLIGIIEWACIVIGIFPCTWFMRCVELLLRSTNEAACKNNLNPAAIARRANADELCGRILAQSSGKGPADIPLCLIKPSLARAAMMRLPRFL